MQPTIEDDASDSDKAIASSISFSFDSEIEYENEDFVWAVKLLFGFGFSRSGARTSTRCLFTTRSSRVMVECPPRRWALPMNAIVEFVDSIGFNGALVVGCAFRLLDSVVP